MPKQGWMFALLASGCIAATGALAQPAPAPAPAEQKDAAASDAEAKKQQLALERAEAEKKAKAKQQQLEVQCLIKPVMSDADIEKCRVAYPVK